MNFHRRVPIAKAFVVLAFSILGALLVFEATVVVRRSTAASTGPSPSFTGAPLESNCTACHTTFEVNTGSGNMVISGLPRTYLPGQSIPLTVTVNDTSGVLFGFQMTSVDPAGDRAGTFVLPAPSPSPALPGLQIVNGIVGQNQNRQYIEHTNQGITPAVPGTRSWQFSWTAPARRVGKLGLYAAGNAANSDNSPDNDQIYTTSRFLLSGPAASNFDGDATSDISVYRPSEGVWYSVNTDSAGFQQVAFGLPGDIPVPGDYDGDGITDRAIYRPSDGTWWVLKSTGGHTATRWGLATDRPAQGDYDGDGKTDLAVFRPSDGVWWVLFSSGSYTTVNWGLAEDIVVQADYDADARTDFAVYRPSTGAWYILQSSDGFFAEAFGLSTDVPVPSDFDGDGRFDIAVYRPSSGDWWIRRSSGGIIVRKFGISEDVPAPGDFDADGRSDIAVFRPSLGDWYIWRSSDSNISGLKWGIAGDVPVPKAYSGN